MTIKFLLLVNKQGQTRLAKYTDSSLTTDERRALEAEIVRKCLTRVDKQVHCARRRSPPPAPAHRRGYPTAARRTTLLLLPACPPNSVDAVQYS